MKNKDKIKALNIKKDSLLSDYSFYYMKLLNGEKNIFTAGSNKELNVIEEMGKLEKNIDLINKEILSLENLENKKIQKTKTKKTNKTIEK